MQQDTMASYFTQRQPALPQLLQLGEQSITLLQWLRTLPGRRYVARAQWQEQTVLAKLFIGQQAKRAFLREIRGAEMLQQARLLSPKLLASGAMAEGFFIIFEWLDDASSLLRQWQAADGEQRSKVLARAVDSIAAMHQQGLWQQDLHLDNFLLKEDVIYLIDAGSVKSETLGQALSPAKALANWAILLAQLPRSADKTLIALLPASCDKQALKKQTEAVRRWRIKDYLDKTARDCSLFYFHKNSQGMSACVREQQSLLSVLEQADALLEQAFIYKTGGTATVGRLEGQPPLIIKRYNIKHFKHWLKRCWRPSRAWHSWQAGQLLNFLNIPCVKPLAVKEKRRLGLRFEAWLVTEYCSEDSLMQRFEPYIETGAVPEKELRSLQNLLQAMRDEKISHGDFKAFNIIWYQERFMLIDLDAVKRHRSRSAFLSAFAKDRARLLSNWPKNSALYQRLEAELPHG